MLYPAELRGRCRVHYGPNGQVIHRKCEIDGTRSTADRFAMRRFTKNPAAAATSSSDAACRGAAVNRMVMSEFDKGTYFNEFQLSLRYRNHS